MLNLTRPRQLKIAIACSGLGVVRRGFETFAQDLFRNLQSVSQVEVKLFKGGGQRAPDEFPLWNVPRNSLFWRGVTRWIDPYVGEQMTFAVALARRLKKGSFDIVHISDGQLGSSLLRLFPGNSRKFKTVFSNGGPLVPSHYAKFDLIQQVSPTELERALAYGLSSSRMTLLPYGISVSNYHHNPGKNMRSHLRIPASVPLLLTVGAHGTHKRLEFIIQQIANMDDNTHLLIVGEEVSNVTPRLKEFANRLLGNQVSFASVRHKAMPSLYAVADLYVHASLREGLSLALLEAMATGLPIIFHNEPGLKWAVGDAGVAVDMTSGEQLSGAIDAILADPIEQARLAERGRKRAEEMFSWGVLLPQYLKMYEQVLTLTMNM